MYELDANLHCKACGRDFAHLNAYSSHFSSCRQGKRKMASALELAKENHKIKRSRIQTTSNAASCSELCGLSEGNHGGQPQSALASVGSTAGGETHTTITYNFTAESKLNHPYNA